MGCTRLPLELIDAILGYLHGNKQALAACSLVCKAWVHSARRKLFEDAILDRAGIEKLVESKTAAIPFVRRLHLNGYFGLQFFNETFPLLVGFNNVRSLELGSLPWNDMTPNAQSVLLTQFASVVCLCLFYSGFTKVSQLAQVICAFPRLETLVINLRNWNLGDSIPSTLIPPQSLRVLELWFCKIDDILELFLSFERMPPLHTVNLHEISLDSFNTLDKFLQSLGPSLEVFSYNPYDFDGWPISLGHNTRLRSFRVESIQSSDVVDITRTLSQIVSTHIDEVHFTLFYHPHNGEDEEWDKVDKILTQPPFSDLNRVKFVCFRVVSAQELAKFRVWAVTHLPRCHRHGILDTCENSRKI